MHTAKVVLASGKTYQVAFNKKAFSRMLAQLFPDLRKDAGEITVDINPQYLEPLSKLIKLFGGNLYGLMIPFTCAGYRLYRVNLFSRTMGRYSRSEKRLLDFCALCLAHEVGHIIYFRQMSRTVRVAQDAVLPCSLLSYFVPDKGAWRFFKFGFIAVSISLSAYHILNTKRYENFARSFAAEQLKNEQSAALWESCFTLKQSIKKLSI